MDPTTVLSLAIAEAAILIAAGIVIVMWRRHRRQRRASRLRHPAAPPPLHVSVVTDDGRTRLRIDVRPDVPPLHVDIASFRIRDTDDWQDVPIAEPTAIGPGGWALLPGVAPAGAEELDVVIGWTLDHAEGAVTGLRTFMVSAHGGPAQDRFRRQTAAAMSTLPAIVVLALLAGGAVYVGSALWSELDGEATPAASDR